MAWQKITKHVSDQRLIVESKAGKTYPVETEYDRFGRGVYEQMMNGAHEDKTYWAWVSFDGDTPVVEDWTRKPDGTGPPEKPPWDH